MKSILRNPPNAFRRVYLQSVAIIQAPDMLPDGQADMCDSCPDMTVYDGKLINSCRMDEYRKFGGFVNIALHEDKRDPKAETETKADAHQIEKKPETSDR